MTLHEDDEPTVAQKLLRLLLVKDTALLRFWFAICTIAWGFWILTDPSFDRRHYVLDQFINRYLGFNSTTLALIFLANGSTILMGSISGYYTRLLLIFEPVLACLLWTLVAITDWIILQSAAPTAGGALVALYLVARYPTIYSIPKIKGGNRAGS